MSHNLKQEMSSPDILEFLSFISIEYMQKKQEMFPTNSHPDNFYYFEEVSTIKKPEIIK